VRDEDRLNEKLAELTIAPNSTVNNEIAWSGHHPEAGFAKMFFRRR
jgi:hypothetical protein